MFNNIRGSGVRVLEEEVCDPASLAWHVFSGHVSSLHVTEARAVLLWPDGVSVDNSAHGLVQLLTPAVAAIRATFTFRCRPLYLDIIFNANKYFCA